MVSGDTNTNRAAFPSTAISAGTGTALKEKSPAASAMGMRLYVPWAGKMNTSRRSDRGASIYSTSRTLTYCVFCPLRFLPSRSPSTRV